MIWGKHLISLAESMYFGKGGTFLLKNLILWGGCRAREWR